MNFLAPLGLLALLLSIPIILLYMLRLRRREVKISSTFLWQQVVRDQEANTPWQRLRRNLLLLLQLVILALLAVALARPFIQVPSVSVGQTVILWDASASMNSVDVNGISRFEDARRIALEAVDTLNIGSQMTVILVTDTPQVLIPLSNDPVLLRQAIESAQPSNGGANWSAALTLASAGGQDFTTVILSDGGAPLQTALATASSTLPGNLSYLPIGTSGDNLAITAFATRVLPGQAPELFAEITSYIDQEVAVIVDLRVDGELLTAERVVIPARGRQSVLSQALPEGFQAVEARLTIPAEADYVDYLALDDRAFAVAETSETRRGLIMTRGNIFLEQIARSLPGIRAFMGNVETGLTGGAFDVYIFDGWVPNPLPSGDLFFINPPNDSSLFTVGNVLERPIDTSAYDPTANINVQRNDPRMLYVDFSTVNIRAFREVTANWAEPLISADGGPLLLAGEVDGRQIAILTFDLADSNLPLQIAFPVMMSAIMDWFSPPSIINSTSARDSLRVGQTVILNSLPNATAIRVTTPAGDTRVYEALESVMAFAETNQVGLYRVDALRGEQVIQTEQFAVNLFAVPESQIAPQSVSAVIAGGETLIEEEIGQREVWPVFALLAFIVLMIEWYAHHRRLRAPTLFSPLRRRAT